MVPELTIAGYAVPVILTIVMGLLFKFIPVIPDQFKAVLTIGVAVILAVVSMFYNPPEVITFRIWIDHILGGLLIGAGAIGVYEGARTFYRPRDKPTDGQT